MCVVSSEIKSDNDLKLCILSPEHLHKAAELAADAFSNNPLYTAICKDDNAGSSSSTTTTTTTTKMDDIAEASSCRKRFLCWLFERNFRLRLGTSVNKALYNQEGELVACFMFVAPDIPDVGFLDMIRVGILMAPILFGLGVVQRFLHIKGEYERIEEEISVCHMKEQPIYKLERMVVRPDMQGRGIGTRALQQALCEADETALPVMLGTQEERNVRFYKRLGFEVLRTDVIANHTSWTMIRQPKNRQQH